MVTNRVTRSTSKRDVPESRCVFLRPAIMVMVGRTTGNSTSNVVYNRKVGCHE